MKWYFISMTCLFFLGLIGGLGCFSEENSNNNSAGKKSKADENESLGSGCFGLLIFFFQHCWESLECSHSFIGSWIKASSFQ
jgi:hypothetical protein